METVKTLLNMKKLKELKIVAGCDGVNNEIRTITILDAPDSYKWLKGREFILTSGFMLLILFNMIGKVIWLGTGLV